MAIPAMISKFGQQQVDYGAAIGASLAQLGQQVGRQLAMQEYRKQAAAELPFMQEAMKGAMNKINAGDVSGGYMEAMMALPLGSQNPIVASAAENYFNGLQQAAEFKQSSLWNQLQREQMMGRGGGVDFETEVVYETPTAEQMADPNYRPIARIVPKATGGAAPITPMGDLSLREQALEIDRQTPLPSLDVDFTETLAETDMGDQDGGRFEFGWSYQEGYRPTADRRKSFEKEYNDFLNAPVEEQEKIKEQAQVPQESVPEGKQMIPFRMALNPDIVGIVGPKSSVEVEKITQVFKNGSQEDRRDLIKKDPLAATINDLQKADSIISSNNTLLNVHRQIDGNYSRVTTEREFISEDPKNDQFKIFIDGSELPDLRTDANGAEAIGIMKAKDVAALTGKYGFVTGQPAEAAAEGAPPPTAAPGAPAAAPPLPAAPDNPFAQPAEREAARLSGAKEARTKAQREREIRRLTQQLQALAPRKTAGLMALEAGAEGEPAAGMSQTEQADLKQEYDRLYWRIDRLKAIDEGRVFETEAEARASKKSFKKGTVIYIAGKMAEIE